MTKQIVHSLVVVGLLIGAGAWGVEGEEAFLLPGDRRGNALWTARLAEAEALLEAAEGGTPARTLVETAPLEKHVPAVPITADVTGLDYVWLLSKDGGDGTGGDHTTWVDPVITYSDGTTASAMDLPIVASDAGWREITVARAGHKSDWMRRREHYQIASCIYTNGWWNHPDGAFCLKLGGKVKTLSVWVGAEKDSSESGKIAFAISSAVPRKRLVKMLGKNLRDEFPEMDRLLARDLGAKWYGHAAFFKLPQAKRRAHLSRYGRADAVARLQAQAAAEELEKAVRFVAEKRPLPAALTARLAAVRDEQPGGGTDGEALLARLVALRREVILLHPLLDFPDLLVNKQPSPTYSHQCDQYLGQHNHAGPGLVILRNWKSARPEAIELLAGKLPRGSVAHPDLSFDGKKIVFAFSDCTVREHRGRRFWLWEIGVDGTGLRQLTGTSTDAQTGWGGRETALVEDFDPCYLPDGGIAFVSTRCQTFGRCHAGRYTPAYLLYRMNGDGTGIRQLSFGEANEWDPSVLADGRIIYTRWDYINRHDVRYQSLWSIHPDGTGTAHFYGNYTRNPCMTAEARAIPGSDHIVCTATAHHGLTAGSLLEIDPAKGQDGYAPLKRLTPEVAFPETEDPTDAGAYQTPWPLGEGFFLAAYTPSEAAAFWRRYQPNDFGIVLIDPLGGRTEIYRDDTVSTISPIPLRARERPPILASSLPRVPAGTPGRLVIQNANLGPEPFGEPIRAIRVNEIIGQPTARVPHRSVVMQEIVKRVLGTATVDAEGACAVEIPSGRPLQLQALGTNGMAVMTMRSAIYAQPGETLACVGCHEPKAQAPVGQTPPRAVQHLRPLKGQNAVGGFDYAASVQPVLNRHCVKCHGGARCAGGLDLTGEWETLPCPDYPSHPDALRVPRSYKTLVERDGLVARAKRNEETESSRPRDYFAAAGRLAPHLLAGHAKSLLSDQDGFACLLAWLDLNAQCYGDYSWSRPVDGGNGHPPANGTCGLKPCKCGCCWVSTRERKTEKGQ